MTSPRTLRDVQEAVWKGSLPLEIRLSPADCRNYDKSDPYYIHAPRLSYLPLLLSRLHSFYTSVLIDPDVQPASGWFTFENVPLKWHHPIGLLYDLFSGATPFHPPQRGHQSPPTSSSSLPWRLILHYSSFPADQLVPLDPHGKAVHDAFINSVKEADFLRNGTANAIMKLSRDDSTTLWTSVQNHNLSSFISIQSKLLPPSSSLRHVPMRIYLPSLPSPEPTEPSTDPAAPEQAEEPPSNHLKVIQSLVKPCIPGTNERQTLGNALHSLLPSLFPSRRTPILARPVLHGCVVPMSSPVEDLMRSAAYADGWVALGVEMMG